jgi:hypothetical protein
MVDVLRRLPHRLQDNLFSASLPPGTPLSCNDWTITTAAHDRRRAVPLIAQPPKRSWDHYGLHNPSYAAGVVAHGGRMLRRERIYYTGRGSRSFVENARPLAIGVMEKTPDGWIRRPEPVLRGTADYPRVLEPKMRYYEGKWRMWYVAMPKVAGKKTPPAYQVRYVESDDGLANWSSPQVLFSTAEGFYDAVVTKSAGGYELVTCQSGNLANKPGSAPQGIWWLTSPTPSGVRQQWTSSPVRILEAGAQSKALVCQWRDRYVCSI